MEVGANWVDESLLALRAKLGRLAAKAEGAPTPEEIAERAEAERARVQQAAGVCAIVDSLRETGGVGEWVQYTACVRLSRRMTRAEFAAWLRSGCERPKPDSDAAQ